MYEAYQRAEMLSTCSIWTVLKQMSMSNPSLFASSYPYHQSATVKVQFWYVALDTWLASTYVKEDNKETEQHLLIDTELGVLSTAHSVPNAKTLMLEVTYALEHGLLLSVERTQHYQPLADTNPALWKAHTQTLVETVCYDNGILSDWSLVTGDTVLTGKFEVQNKGVVLHKNDQTLVKIS